MAALKIVPVPLVVLGLSGLAYWLGHPIIGYTLFGLTCLLMLSEEDGTER